MGNGSMAGADGLPAAIRAAEHCSGDGAIAGTAGGARATLGATRNAAGG
jgi:hypothetical protein